MDYAMQTIISGDFDSVCEQTRQALAAQGFGVLNEIDLQATLKKKLDKAIPPYRILGACHPPSAYAAIQAEPLVGLMLPCNVTVRELGPEQAEVAAIDPTAMMAPVGNPDLDPVAEDVRQRLQLVLNTLGRA